jgi:hypothetical protein
MNKSAIKIEVIKKRFYLTDTSRSMQNQRREAPDDFRACIDPRNDFRACIDPRMISEPVLANNTRRRDDDDHDFRACIDPIRISFEFAADVIWMQTKREQPYGGESERRGRLISELALTGQ